MRVIRESSADEVESYVRHIHSVYKSSYLHTLKTLSRMNHHKWYLVELDLINEIGSVVNVHEHRDNGRAFWLSTAKESWVEAFRRFPTRSRKMPTHECPKRISAILDEMAKNVQYPVDFPLILEVTSLRPLGLQHIDGIHRAAAYITGGYEGSVHCYVAVPSHLSP